MKVIKKLESKLDRSVNFVFDNGQEARYVNRGSHIIVYLSSHNGCGLSCRMCHLTQTGQVDMVPTECVEFLDQTHTVLNHYLYDALHKGSGQVTRVNFDWMARGEPLDNEHLCSNWKLIKRGLLGEAYMYGMQEVRFNVSTIIPAGLEKNLYNFKNEDEHKVAIYYSMYSVDESFRKRWLPKAAGVNMALSHLATWQDLNRGEVVIHGAFIEGENDSDESIHAMKEAIRMSGINARFNLVRYNPYSTAQGKEPSEERLVEILDSLSEVMTLEGSKIVSRVGFDVNVSCGMFVDRGDKS